MARSERFDHFTAVKHTPGAEQSEPAKPPGAHRAEHTPNGHSHHGAPDIHYGHKFAQTEEKLHQRALEHREAEKHEAEHPSKPTAPIGAVPAAETPAPSIFPSPELISLWSEAQRTSQEALRSGRAALAAVYKLSTLPLEAARVVVHDVEGFFSLGRT